MRITGEQLPGLRRPTAAERAWIAAQWLPYYRGLPRPRPGRLLRAVGILLICIGTASIARDTTLAGGIVTLLVGLGTLGAYSLKRGADRSRLARIQALERGDYLVAPATAAKLLPGDGLRAPGAMAQVILPDGTPMKGTYWLPWESGRALIASGPHNAPLLLIRFPGDPELLAIPRQSGPNAVEE